MVKVKGIYERMLERIAEDYCRTFFEMNKKSCFKDTGDYYALELYQIDLYKSLTVFSEIGLSDDIMIDLFGKYRNIF